MKNCHNDHDSHLIRDWSEAHSGGGNRFFQVSTFISIATANINRLYEVFFQKTHLLRPLLLALNEHYLINLGSFSIFAL